MKRLAILGASGHGMVVAEIAELAGWKSITFFDDKYQEIEFDYDWPVSGNSTDLLSMESDFDGVFIAIGDNATRQDFTQKFEDSKLAVLKHPSAVVSKTALLGSGTVVMANVTINAKASIGIGAILNTGSTIDHQCELGNFVHVSPGVNLAGQVTVGEKTWIGVGASVIQNISIGTGTTIGSGSVVISDIPKNCVAAGVPCTVLKTKG